MVRRSPQFIGAAGVRLGCRDGYESVGRLRHLDAMVMKDCQSNAYPEGPFDLIDSCNRKLSMVDEVPKKAFFKSSGDVVAVLSQSREAS